MVIAEQEIISETKIAKHDKNAVKQILLDEAKLGLLLTEKGINYSSEEIKKFQDRRWHEPLPGQAQGGH